MFEDEFGISFTEPVGPTWAPCGETPHLKRIGKYRREISYMAGLTVSGRILKKCFEGSVNSEKLIQGLEHFRRCIGGSFILIWDRSRSHRGKLMKDYLADHPEILTALREIMDELIEMKSPSDDLFPSRSIPVMGPWDGATTLPAAATMIRPGV